MSEDRHHPTMTCFMLMKRCRLPACKDQRGHIRASHKNFPHMSLEGQRKKLKMAFEEVEGRLTGKEKEVIRRYEGRV